MLEDFFTQLEAERFLLNRKAAVVIGICMIPSASLIFLRERSWDLLLPKSHLTAEVIFWSVILPTCVTALALLAGTGLFIFRCGPQPPRDTLWWSLMLLLAFPFTEIAVYIFLYIPAVRARLAGFEQTTFKLEARS